MTFIKGLNKMTIELFKEFETGDLEGKLRTPGISLHEHDEVVKVLGQGIYERFKDELEDRYFGKRAAIVFAHHSPDNLARIYIADSNMDTITLAGEVQKRHEVSIPYLKYIGDTKDDPKCELLATPFEM